MCGAISYFYEYHRDTNFLSQQTNIDLTAQKIVYKSTK